MERSFGDVQRLYGGCEGISFRWAEAKIAGIIYFFYGMPRFMRLGPGAAMRGTGSNHMNISMELGGRI